MENHTSPNRRLLHATDGKVSYLQIIGFLLVLAGLICMLVEKIVGKLPGENIAIDFFTIMMGIAFAFPDLFRDSNKGLSTMRIVVFMMVNVICLLMLKIGWDLKSLKDIGLDQYWMGIIAFIFGAKATQAYFESKLAAVTAKQDTSDDCKVAPTPPVDSGAVPATGPSANNIAPPVPPPDLDGCDVTPVKSTADEDLPASKGGVK